MSKSSEIKKGLMNLDEGFKAESLRLLNQAREPLYTLSVAASKSNSPPAVQHIANLTAIILIGCANLQAALDFKTFTIEARAARLEAKAAELREWNSERVVKL